MDALPGKGASSPAWPRSTSAATTRSGPKWKALLKEAGICNYTIWSDGEELFGYYECEKGIAFAERTQAGSPIVDRWNAYMEDVLELEMDPETGAQPKLRQMFLLE